MTKTTTQAKLSTGKANMLLIHIVKRDEDGNMKDKTLCGKLWDKPVVTSKNICEECKEIAKRDGHDALRPA